MPKVTSKQHVRKKALREVHDLLATVGSSQQDSGLISHPGRSDSSQPSLSKSSSTFLSNEQPVTVEGCVGERLANRILVLISVVGGGQMTPKVLPSKSFKESLMSGPMSGFRWIPMMSQVISDMLVMLAIQTANPLALPAA